jgi:hypothetical protein
VCVFIYQQALRGELAAGSKRNRSNAQRRHNLRNSSSSSVASKTRQQQFSPSQPEAQSIAWREYGYSIATPCAMSTHTLLTI